MPAMTGFKKAVFVDRDDTINRDVRYCSRAEDFELMATAGAGIRLLNKEGQWLSDLSASAVESCRSLPIILLFYSQTTMARLKVFTRSWYTLFPERSADG